MELTNEEKSALILFSKIVRAHKYKTVVKEYPVDYDGSIDYDYLEDEWFSYEERGGGSIDSIASVDKIIERFFNETNLDFFENGGTVEVLFHAEEKLITFKANINTTSTNSVGGVDIEFDELPREMKTWFQEIKNRESVSDGVVTYSGGGDDGWVEREISFNSGHHERIPQFVADWIANNLDYNWYDNEGGQGQFVFDFKNGTITSECEENYDDTYTMKMYNIINFNENESK